MKMVTAVVQPKRLDSVREALSDVGVTGITATEVKGFGRQKGHTELYRGAEFVVEFLPKVKLEIAITDIVQYTSHIVLGDTTKHVTVKIFIIGDLLCQDK